MNWTRITPDDLKATGLGFVVDRARSEAVGGVDPAADAIATAVARVRRAITGSALDADAQKVPMSLKAVAVRAALFALYERLGLPLGEDQREARKADTSDLLRLSDKRIPVELPDDNGGSAEMATMGGIEAVNTPARLTGRDKCGGL